MGVALHNETKRPLIVGIAGGSCSGKTTLSEMIINSLGALKVKSVHIDDYFKAVKPKMIAPVTRVEYDDYNHPDSVEMDKLLYDMDKLMTSKDGYDVIIVEGLFTLYNDSLRNLLDLKIFIDVRSDERLVRRIKRNMQRGLSFDKITDYYLDAVRYRYDEFVEPSRWHADIVLNGSSFSKAGLQMIREWILSRAK